VNDRKLKAPAIADRIERSARDMTCEDDVVQLGEFVHWHAKTIVAALRMGARLHAILKRNAEIHAKAHRSAEGEKWPPPSRCQVCAELRTIPGIPVAKDFLAD
jgi:hypothetical protein